MVFYRKYRPQTIAELDSAHIRETLYSVLSQQEGPHAYLFTGPKGLGKTSTARIVAKALNCEGKGERGKGKGKEDIEPCNKCSQCVSITNGTNMDILEIDGASNRGIDEIRDLREKVRLAPVGARKKVYIIDEVHMLTTEAFNALLKTLEEPPAHVVFILCTTEPHKVPDTIISRCFHIPFTLATHEELFTSFKRMLEQEKIDIDEQGLSYIANLADGSFRDGAKVLEELVTLANGKKITKELVEQKYHASSIKQHLKAILISLVEKNAKSGLSQVAQLTEQGVDIQYFIEQLVSQLHKVLLYKVGVKDQKIPIPTVELSVEEIKKLIELLTKAYGEVKYAVLPSLPLELAIVEWSSQSKVEEKKEFPRPLGERVRVKDDSSDNKLNWPAFVNAVKKSNVSIAGVLRGCSLKSYDEKEFIIQTNYEFHKDRLMEKKARELLTQVVKEVSGKDVKVTVLLTKV